MAEGHADDRTEAATPRRLQRAREAGDVAVSRELVSLATLGAGALVLAYGTDAGPDFTASLTALLRAPGRLDLSDGGAAALRLAAACAGAAAPCVLAVLVAGALAVLLQTNFLISPAALRPSFARLDPRAGLARLVGAEGLAEAVRSVVKIAVVGLALWRALGADAPGLADALRWTPDRLLAQARLQVQHVVLAVLAAQAAIAVLDLLWVRLRHARQLRMSRQDIREETRETEGDPRIKARIRQIRALRARRRMMAAVPRATVVITNPTHYAVALAYDRAHAAAPRVVAKGVDDVAMRIREVARAHRVPLVSNPPLARALYTVELDTDIPAEHYRAVAEIIAYVWRLGVRAGALRPQGRAHA